jgi:hypothetical protein
LVGYGILGVGVGGGLRFGENFEAFLGEIRIRQCNLGFAYQFPFGSRNITKDLIEFAVRTRMPCA